MLIFTAALDLDVPETGGQSTYDALTKRLEEKTGKTCFIVPDWCTGIYAIGETAIKVWPEPIS